MQQSIHPIYEIQTATFAKWILDIGDGIIGDENDDYATIQVPAHLLITQYDDSISGIVKSTFPDLDQHHNNPEFFKSKAILVSTNETIEQINHYVLSFIPDNYLITYLIDTCSVKNIITEIAIFQIIGDHMEYLSSDSVDKSETNEDSYFQSITTKFLNSLNTSGLPTHSIKLKIGSPIMLLRNLDQNQGLCNGIRLVVTKMTKHVIAAEIISGKNIDLAVYIPRMSMSPSQSPWPFKLLKRQFPIMLSYAMAINKSQGLLLSMVGLYLPKPVFTHGQLYVALLRVNSTKGLKILIHDDEQKSMNSTTNVVFKECYSFVITSCREYLSSDSVDKSETNEDSYFQSITTKFLNSLNTSGLPTHSIKLKIGSPIMLLRNLDQNQGLCNGIRLVVTKMTKHVIAAEIISGKNIDLAVYIPRMSMSPSQSPWPFKLLKRQFPIMLSYAMAINKSQGLLLSMVGLYLPKPVFTHGQLYVALLRVNSTKGLKILIHDDEQKSMNSTTNVVFKECYSFVITSCREYLSSDSVDKSETNEDSYFQSITTKFLNSLNTSGLPTHSIKLKIGSPIMLLRNLDQNQGLCNGIRLVVTKMTKHVIAAEIISGKNIDLAVYIPRMSMSPSQSPWPFKLLKRQFPIMLSYAMAINKSQGLLLSMVGLYLPKPVFTHGQLYVALLRVNSTKGLKILIHDDEQKSMNSTTNVVFKECYSFVITSCREYLSSDSVDKSETNEDSYFQSITTKFLNSLNTSGLPTHSIKLKIGSPIMLLRNLDQNQGLCNGIRLVVTKMTKHVIAAEIISGKNIDLAVYIPRMSMSPSQSPWPFKLLKRQFPIMLSYAMAINKSQGLLLSMVGLYLPKPVFTHGQLYVALLRVNSTKGLKILIHDDEQKSMNSTTNVVFKECYSFVITSCREYLSSDSVDKSETNEDSYFQSITTKFLNSLNTSGLPTHSIKLKIGSPIMLLRNLDQNQGLCNGIRLVVTKMTKHVIAAEIISGKNIDLAVYIPRMSMSPSQSPWPFKLLKRQFPIMLSYAMAINKSQGLLLSMVGLYLPKPVFTHGQLYVALLRVNSTKGLKILIHDDEQKSMNSTTNVVFKECYSFVITSCREYLSSDSVDKSETNEDSYFQSITTKFLNSLNTSGLPTHSIKLKIGSPIMLLRNLDQNQGLCNGIRLVVTKMTKHVIAAEIISGKNIDLAVYIPRMSMSPSQSPWPFKLLKRQFPIMLSYAMAINKSQGLLLSMVGLYLPKPVFTHGQLYVALLRVNSTKGLKILIHDDEQKSMNSTTNVVFKECYSFVITSCREYLSSDSVDKSETNEDSYFQSITTKFLNSLNTSGLPTHSIKLKIGSPIMLLRNLDQNQGLCNGIRLVVTKMTKHVIAAEIISGKNIDLAVYIPRMSMSPSQSPWPFKLLKRQFPIMLSYAMAINKSQGLLLSMVGLYLPKPVFTHGQLYVALLRVNSTKGLKILIHDDEQKSMNSTTNVVFKECYSFVITSCREYLSSDSVDKSETNEDSYFQSITTKFLNSLNTSGLPTHSIKLKIGSPIMLLRNLDQNQGLCNGIRLVVTKMTKHVIAAEIISGKNIDLAVYIPRMSMSPSQSPWPFKLLKRQFPIMLSYAMAINKSQGLLLSMVGLYLPKPVFTHGQLYVALLRVNSTKGLKILIHDDEQKSMNSTTNVVFKECYSFVITSCREYLSSDSVDKSETNEDSYFQSITTKFLNSLNTSGLPTHSIKLKIGSPIMLLRNLDQNQGLCNGIRLVVTKMTKHVIAAEIISGKNIDLAVYIPRMSMSPSQSPWPFKLLKRQFPIMLSYAMAINKSQGLLLSMVGLYLPKPVFTHGQLYVALLRVNSTKGLKILIHDDEQKSMNSTTNVVFKECYSFVITSCREYLSSDSVDKSETNEDSYFQSITTKFLNSLNTSGLPTHSIKLKIGSPIMLLRNLDQNQGLCNGIRLVVTKMTKHVIAAEIISGKNIDLAVYIPRMSMSPSQSPWPFKLLKRQFPIMLSYAMAINKSQGLLLSMVGLYLPKPVFTHGQLYVALLRVNSTKGLKILIHDDEQKSMNSTTNVVFKECYSFVITSCREYLSSDSVDKSETNEDSYFQSITTKFLNSLNTSGLPTHSIKLKIGSPIMLLRNLDQNQGLCNGIRLVVTKMTKHVIAAEIISGKNIDLAVYIPRMSMSPSQSPWPFKLLKRQFPIMLSYAMAINKSQGLLLSMVGLYLPKPVFTHGQLYVALLRVNSTKGLKILIHDDEQKSMNSTTNVVFKECYSFVITSCREYLSSDSVDKSETNEDSYFQSITTKFLNSLNTSGLPTHSIKLKIGSPIMLLRNLDQNQGLCNGIRLVVTKMTKHVIAAEIISGKNIDLAVYIPRMSMSPSQSPWPFKLLKRQFPIMLSYAMAINKSQGLLLSMVGLYLPKPVFTHGQLYVALLRVNSTKGLKILIHDDEQKSMNSTTNVVFKECYSFVITSCREYLSSDSVDKSETNEDSYFQSITTKFLNSLNTSGLPTHSIKLKIGSPIMLLRNLDQNQGLCNGIRLVVTKMTKHVIAAEIISGKNIDLAVYIPRMSMSPSQSPWPFKLLKRQFPIMLSYAMAINKSQGLLLSMVGLYLPKPVFTHGQLYVALLRVNSTKGLKILIHDDEQKSMNSTTNVVFKEVFRNIKR
ncbi:ATP-dependent DNA helicase PIF1 [Glycine max]|nr:ATP-dependent DNA helicase PIF1 [Glycine max]